MKRIDAFGATATNRFTSGDPVAGVPATRVSADFMNVIQEEIASTIEFAGITVDQSHTYDGGNDTAQLRKAIQALIAAAGTVPIGSVQAYAGETAPTGWLHCDGSSLSSTEYPDLFAAIGHAWGGGGSLFNLPDLRGRFLRGYDGGAGNDPDAASRVLSNDGGNTGDAVGTLQNDELKSHTHSYTTKANLFPQSGSSTQCWSGTATGTSGATGGNETRPKNASVMFIIKAGTAVGL